MLNLDYSLDYSAKCERVEQIVESYYLQHRKNPPTALLEELSNYLLSDVFANKSRTKAITEEYPILSTQQIKRREKRELMISDEGALSYYKICDKIAKKRSRNYEES